MANTLLESVSYYQVPVIIAILCEANVPDPLAIKVRETQLLRVKNFPVEENVQATKLSIKKAQVICSNRGLGGSNRHWLSFRGTFTGQFLNPFENVARATES
jgi:hypothetical protein